MPSSKTPVSYLLVVGKSNFQLPQCFIENCFFQLCLSSLDWLLQREGAIVCRISLPLPPCLDFRNPKLLGSYGVVYVVGFQDPQKIWILVKGFLVILSEFKVKSAPNNFSIETSASCFWSISFEQQTKIRNPNVSVRLYCLVVLEPWWIL